MNAVLTQVSNLLTVEEAEKNLRWTLMVVDDDVGPREALQILFKSAYEVVPACNGAEAVEIAQQRRVDVAILDIRMAGMNGIDVLERLKQVDPAIEVIMLTAYETLETARQALRLGACDYLSKPFDIGTIREAVAHAMERRAVSDQIQNHHKTLMRLQQEIHSQKLQEEISRTRSEIYASILHDINGPLTVISGFVDLVVERLGLSNVIEGAELATVRDRMSRISRQVNSCRQISHRYLSFLRGRFGEDNQVSVNQVLADLGELLHSHPSARGHSFVVRQLEQDCIVQMNGTDFMQVLLNLTVNAFQSGGSPHEVSISGHVLLKPAGEDVFTDGPNDVSLNRDRLRNQPPLLSIVVADTGPGIPSGILRKVFDPYFTTKPAGIGTGLGLSIVRRLIEQAQGAIHLHSVSDVGTSFNLLIPARTK